jgi:hypothetical protein
MNQKPIISPVPVALLGSLDTFQASGRGGRELGVEMDADRALRTVCGEPRTMHRWASVGQPCLDCGAGFWTTKPCPALVGPFPQEPAPGSPEARGEELHRFAFAKDITPEPEAVAQAAETIRDLDQYYFASAINGNTVRVFRDARTCEPYFDDRYELKLSRVQGAEILRLAQQQYELADALEAARNTIRSLADQQAMPDDSWRVVDEQIESALRKAGRA